MSNKCRVLILKASPEESNGDDRYLDFLASQRISALMVPTLKFQFKNLNLLVSRLLDFENYSGLLLSSPRCAEAVTQCFNDRTLSGILDKWKNLKCFVVGEATSREVEMNLGLKHEGSSSGNMTALLKYLRSYQLEKPLLMPCGNLHKESDEERIISIEKMEIYETIEHPGLGNSIKNLITSYQSQSIFVFFSPSGVKFAVPYIMKIDVTNFKFVAIGPTTAKAMNNNNLPVHAVCEKPSPESLLQVVLQLIEDK